jgi:hypothetical protein
MRMASLRNEISVDVLPQGVRRHYRHTSDVVRCGYKNGHYIVELKARIDCWQYQSRQKGGVGWVVVSDFSGLGASAFGVVGS